MIIVEGPSDERILKRAFGSGVSYFSAGARNIALEESQTLHDWNQDYFTCVVDRDFDDTVKEFEGRQVPIHAYENADLEAMLSVSGAAASLMAEMGSAAKIQEKGGADYILDKLLKMLEPVTILRRANVENSWGIAFDAIDLRSKIDKKSWSLKLQGYCAALNETSGDAPGQKILLQYATGERPLKEMPLCPRSVAPYFRGRDFLAMLSVYLCGYCGTRRAQSVEPEILEAALRLGGADHIRSSPWGRDLMAALSLSPSGNEPTS
ncbi:hypothetical protein [Kitasatospora aureofaciens]|uniref:hypothetical protein n=1 Tax=Kitasatospora aureofaciens TaxID=1894 RepID=UPI0037C594D0